MIGNPSLDYIKNRLSLRTPQAESLDVLDDVCDIILSDDSNEVKLNKISKKYPYFKGFDRNFPSLCFSLATGVGKTRLMGAFITYLYIVKNITNFIVIAPNITIYNKLIKDFSDQSNEKYVFRGISEFIQNQPKIVTGDNYKEQGSPELWESSITINIFNIDKINKDEQSIKSLSEWLGESYYNYLCNLDNLVILMDESHHYRADKGMQVLNELKPVLGLELTATPQIEKNGRSIKFNNIICDYPLFKAMNDGYVKEPSVATRKDFNADNFTAEMLDKEKLNDGLAIHEKTKIALEEYAKQNNLKLVKPFAMVVCSNVEHAKEVLNYIESNEFFSGQYKGKAIEIDSKSGKMEKDENIAKLLMLENPLNKIEIVVHVNMLKEGWDVTNLYTIIPLRTSASKTLTEQTMGRGLRLPYGKRTGVEDVDRLTIVSHDKYQEIIDAAQREDSMLKKFNIEYIDDMDLKRKEIIQSFNIAEQEINEKILNANTDEEKVELDIEKKIIEKVNATSNIMNKNDFQKPQVKKEIIAAVSKDKPLDMFDFGVVYDNIVEKKADNIIESAIIKTINIPDVSINEMAKYKQIYSDFELDLYKLQNYKPLNNEMIIKHLGDGQSLVLTIDNKKVTFNIVKEILFEQLNKISDLDYDSCSEILNSKVDEYLRWLRSKWEETDVINILYNHSYYITKDISQQIKNNVKTINEIIAEPIIKERSPILNHNYTKYLSDDVLDFHKEIKGSEIKSKVFNGYKKACHNLYKFDSNSEKDFAIILEEDNTVIKWLRPADLQFNIYWDHNTRRYEPDFIVETSDKIYIVEIKSEKNIDDTEVQDKKDSAEKYCKAVNDYAKSHNIKKWEYIIIPHTDVKTNYSFGRYI